MTHLGGHGEEKTPANVNIHVVVINTSPSIYPGRKRASEEGKAEIPIYGRIITLLSFIVRHNHQPDFTGRTTIVPLRPFIGPVSPSTIHPSDQEMFPAQSKSTVFECMRLTLGVLAMDGAAFNGISLL